MKIKRVNFENIKIPSCFEITKPREEKIQKHLNYYNRNGHFKKRLVINKFGYLEDGYIDYLILQRQGYTGEIEVELHTMNYENKNTKYVWGKHDGQDKEYLWRMPAKYINENVEIGQRITVRTMKGLAQAIVTNVDILDRSPISMRVRTVVVDDLFRQCCNN